MNKQQLSFGFKNSNSSFVRRIERQKIKTEEVYLDDITFLKGQKESVHRWFRLTPSYSPDLVRYFFNYFKITNDKLIFDPFSGKGTTLIESKKNKIGSVGAEIIPVYFHAIKKSLKWKKISRKSLNLFFNEFEKYINEYKKYSYEETIKKLNLKTPIIHDVFRWWRKNVLKDLLICKKLINDKKYIKIKDYLWMALSMSCLECANIHRNHPTISFDDNSKRKINVFDDIKNRINQIFDDLNTIKANKVKSDILLDDSTKLDNIKKYLVKKKVDYVICSPPYPNRFSYIHQSRPQLYFLDLLKNKEQATEIDLDAIGGTWGRATSIIQKKLLIPEKKYLKIFDYFNKLSKKSILMCNYATKYFLMLDKHIKSLKKIIKKNNFKGCYIVGNSRLSGIEIYTETILSKIFQINGFKIEKIIIFRKRGGKKELFETAVIVKY